MSNPIPQDFFKDYPPVDGSFNASGGGTDDDDTTDPGAGAFVLGGAPADDENGVGDDIAANGDDSHDDNDNVIIPGPPPTDANGTANGDSGDHAYGHPPPADDGDDDDQPENPTVTQWRTDFAKRLEAKMVNERKVKNERSTQAKASLTAMHQRWDRRAKDAMDENRRANKELVRSRDATLSCMSKKGQPPNWNIVPELADLSGTFREGARDTSRMRQVLLRMKTH